MRPFVAWFVVALLVRLLYLTEQQAVSVLFYQQLLDEEEMWRTAEALLDREGFGSEPLFKAPLYPVFLAIVMYITGDAWTFAVRLLQHAGGAALVLLAADTAARLVGGGRARIVAFHGAAALVAFNAPLVRLEHQLLLDFPAVLLQSAMLWALVRAVLVFGHDLPGEIETAARWRLRWLVAASALAGLAWLTRPTLTPVIPLLALLLVVVMAPPRRHLRRALTWAGVFLAGPLLAVALFTTHNIVVGGEALWLPWQGGYNLYEANKRGAHGRYLEQGTFAVSATGNPTYAIMVEEYEKELYAKPAPRSFSFGGVDRFWRNRAIAEVSADPVAWAGLYARKLLYLFNDREVYNIEVFDVQRRESPVLTYATPITFGFVLPLALAAFAFWPLANRGRRRALVIVLVYTATLAAAIALYYASGRLRAPLVFPLVVLAGVGLGRLATVVRQANLRRGLAAGLVVMGAVVAWGDWWGVRSERLDYIEYERMSNAASRAGEFERALDYADRAAADRVEQGKPPSTALPSLRGQALFGLGRIEEAAAAFELAAETQPLDPVAPFNRGWIALFREHDAEAALPWLRRAIQLDRGYKRAEVVLLLAHVKLGRPEYTTDYFGEPGAPDIDQPVEREWLRVAVACAKGDRPAAVAAAQRLRTMHGEAALATMAEELGPLGLDACLKQAP